MELTFLEYQAIVENAPNLIWRANTDSKCDYFNKTWLRFTGRTLEQEQGDGWVEGVHPDDLDRCVKTYLEHFAKHEKFEMEYRLRRHDGQWRWINDHGAPYRHEDGTFAGYIGSCVDVTERVVGNQYKEQAEKDGLTGVLSRQYWLQLQKQCFEQAKQENAGMVLAMLDIDHFKHINDAYGHMTGDTALRLFASVVNNHIRQTDMLGRYGGDEFVIVFPEASLQTAQSVMDRICHSLEVVSLKAGDDNILLTMSVGLCGIQEADSPDQMLHVADQRMYEQKKTKG